VFPVAFLREPAVQLVDGHYEVATNP